MHKTLLIPNYVYMYVKGQKRNYELVYLLA